MDSFLFLDMETLEPSVNISTPMHRQQAICSSDLFKKAPHDSSKEIIPYNNSNEVDSKHPQLQTQTLYQDKDRRTQVISPFQLPTDISEPAVISPLPNPEESVTHHVLPPVKMPSLLHQMPSVVDASASSVISKLKNSKEPTLLTLTSYPYRIIYCNTAFSKLCGRKTAIGDSVFDAFDIEERAMRPCLATFPSLIGRLDNEVALVPSFTDEQDNQYWTRCGVQAYPVNKNDGSNALLYFAVRFTPMHSPL